MTFATKKPVEQPEPLMSMRDAAAALGISYETIRKNWKRRPALAEIARRPFGWTVHFTVAGIARIQREGMPRPAKPRVA